MSKAIKIELTNEQLEKLKPLFDRAAERPMEGMIVGQALKSTYFFESGYAVFEWCTPQKVIKKVIKAVELKAAEQKNQRPPTT